MIIFITGFMMSGKSQLGAQLSTELNLPFLDLDEAIIQKHGISIHDIIKTQGEKAFRHIEFELLKEEVNKTTADRVIALGGGTMCSQEVAQYILKNGIAVYLKRPLEYFEQNVAELIATRPLFSGLTTEKALLRIGSLLRQRRPFYEKSQLQTLANSTFSPKKVANWLKLLTNRSQSL